MLNLNRPTNKFCRWKKCHINIIHDNNRTVCEKPSSPVLSNRDGPYLHSPNLEDGIQPRSEAAQLQTATWTRTSRNCTRKLQKKVFGHGSTDVLHVEHNSSQSFPSSVV